MKDDSRIENDRPTQPADRRLRSCSPPGAEEETDAAIEALRAAIQAAAPPDGPARIHAALSAERAREGRRRAMGRNLGLLVRIAAALLLACGAAALWRWSVHRHNVVLCPHGTPRAQKSESPKSLKAFLSNPDNFQRVCQCRPLYSGNLRHSPDTPFPPPDR